MTNDNDGSPFGLIVGAAQAVRDWNANDDAKPKEILLQGQDLSLTWSNIVQDAISEPEGQELLYSARVSLDETRMQVKDKFVNLAPGMAVTVEIKTGTRRIIEYLMSPPLRYRQESLRER